MPEDKPRVPLGRPLDWSDDELNELAEIKPSDITAARTLWRNKAPRKYKKLLDAKPMEQDGRDDTTNN